jgi:myosin XVIII
MFIIKFNINSYTFSQLLEQAKLKLEMTLDSMRKEIRRESQQQNEEIEEIRSTSYKKIKSLECQLEHEHEERTLLLREKHELERRLNLLEDSDRTERAAEEALIKKLKQDLRKSKALMRDSQAQLERARADSSGKVLIRQLRNQLEDAESAKVSAVRARQIAESELSELQTTLDEIQRAKHDSEEKVSVAQRDLKELQTQLDENEEEMSELMRKYSLIVKQLSAEQAVVSDYQIRISDLESDITILKQQNQDLTARLECFESSDDKNSNILNKRLEMRVKELESRLEFEQITKGRFETQVSRLRDNLEKSQHEISVMRSKEMQAQEGLKKSQKSLRDLREEFHSRLNREQEEITKRKDLEKRLEISASETSSLKNDLRLALKRISDLQQALNDGDSEELDE